MPETEDFSARLLTAVGACLGQVADLPAGERLAARAARYREIS